MAPLLLSQYDEISVYFKLSLIIIHHYLLKMAKELKYNRI